MGLIGYAQYPDGTTDYNRPYHSMPNPNEYITKVLSIYSEQTRYHLQMLKNAVENTKDSRTQGFQPIMLPQQDQTQQLQFNNNNQNPAMSMMNRGKQNIWEI